MKRVIGGKKKKYKERASDRSKGKLCMAKFGEPLKTYAEQNPWLGYKRGKLRKETESLIVAAKIKR